MFVNEIRKPVTALKGAGPTTAAALARAGVVTIADLLQFFPRDYEDRTEDVPFSAFSGKTVDTVGTVVGVEWIGFGRKASPKITVDDGTASASLVCFNRAYVAERLKPGTLVHVRGKFAMRYGELQSSAFEAEPWEEGRERERGIVPVYPLAQGLKQGQVRTLARRALDEFGRFVESELPEAIAARYSLLPKAAALSELHRPSTFGSLERARKTLVYEELFELEILVGRRAFARRRETVARKPSGGLLRKRLIERLPFSLTAGQESALSDILSDMASPSPMARLLQGDVGSGKTLVAFLAALECVEAGGQAVMIAPTELLARQHAENAAKLLEPLGLRIAFLSGNVRESGRKPLLAALAAGELDFIVGTHALFQQDVAYESLRLVVIDEQHRFGVLQRLAAAGKGEMPDVLMMTATPIPRTLALTVYGDLQVSEIRTMPEGRKNIVTHLAEHRNDRKVYDFVRRELEAGRQAYFVYPLVGESETSDLRDAETMAARLAGEIYPGFKVGLVHSRLSEETKRETMRSFAAGETKVLVATSVVEVGVDVPKATCMVVEHAERFGLSSLHQLRGRVGRGSDQSWCFLVYSKSLTEEGKARLKAMLETDDGFAIAEEDLRIRGPGEIAGTAQSGDVRFSIADPARDAKILEAAREDAFALLADDPELEKETNAGLARLFRDAPPFSGVTAARG